jgi:FkbM family methyltransferase
VYSYEADVDRLREGLGPHLAPGFFFVNIGASDGVIADPIYPFMASHRPTGIAVEPVPYVMERLKQNYRDFPGIVFEQVAVADEPRSFWYVEQGSGSIDYVMRSIGSMSRDRILESLTSLRLMEAQIARVPSAPSDTPDELRGPTHEGQAISADVENYVRELEIDCVSFTDLMERNHVERIDFLNIDVEGYDLEVLRSIDWDRYRPTALCVELVGLPEVEVADAEADLDRLGYRRLQDFGLFSTVYVHEG